MSSFNIRRTQTIDGSTEGRPQIESWEIRKMEEDEIALKTLRRKPKSRSKFRLPQKKGNPRGTFAQIFVGYVFAHTKWCDKKPNELKMWLKSFSGLRYLPQLVKASLISSASRLRVLHTLLTTFSTHILTSTPSFLLLYGLQGQPTVQGRTILIQTSTY